MDINELFERTAVVKGEEGIITLLAMLLLQRPAYESAQMVGGFASKLMSRPQYKGRIPLATDLDFIFQVAPEALVKELEPRPLIDKMERRYEHMGVREMVTHSEHLVYDLPEEKFGLVDTFVGTLGGLELPSGLDPTSFDFDLGTRTHRLSIAHPGFLAAACLYAASDKRLSRLRFLLESSDGENTFGMKYHDLREGCKQTLDANKLGATELDVATRRIAHRYRNIPIYRDFMQQMLS
ncbi:hypothetical protein HY497_02120 [Candidatus Woesearchaeota archaeon]|nr:hypothetical protein [Candidatus Woesearchaeota archaeon]